MPLPIKQYKHMFKDVKFLATTAQPSHKEVSHWIDLLEDPTGGTIKVWNGTGWKKISGEGDGDTGLVIGDTTGTAYDGGKGKELETAMDQVHATTNELQDTISSLQTEIENKKIFQFSYVDLQNKTEDFVQRFFDVVSSRIFGPPTNTVFLYNHGRDNDNGQMNLYMTVSDYHFSVGQPIEITFYSTIYHDKNLNRDQFIKLTATISTNNIMNNPTFKIEEVPVDLNSTVSQDSFYVFPEDKLVEGAVLTEDEYSNLQKAAKGQKIALFKNNFMSLSTQFDSSRIYFGVNTNFINREHRAPDDYYSHEFLYLNGSINSERTVHISDEYNKEGSLCYVYGKDRDIMFIPYTTLQYPEKLMEALSMTSNPMFLDVFGSGGNGLTAKIASLDQVNTDTLISSNLIYTVEDGVGIIAQSRYLAESESGLTVSKTISKEFGLILSGDGTKFLSDNGRYKEIDLSSKQDALVSGINIKTVNGNSLLGEGNIEIQGGGNGIADAPSDGKKYIRQNANWVEETTVDTSTKYVNMTVESNVDILDEVTIDGKVYDFINDGIYDTDLLNYLKDIYNADKSLMIEYTEHANDGSIFSTKYNTYVSYRNDGESHEMYAIDLKPISNVIISVADPSNKPQPS